MFIKFILNKPYKHIIRGNALMEKTNYSVARVQTYTRAGILKAERHNERKNTTYSNINVDLAQTQNNVN